MRYTIIHDRPGRLRLRMGSGVFNPGQGYGIEAKLYANPWVLSARANSINGSLLVEYTPGHREDLINFVSALRRSALPFAKPPPDNKIRELDAEFVRQVAFILGRQYIFRLILPTPIRLFMTIRRAASFWKKGIQQLSRGKLGVDVLDACAVTAALAGKDFSTAGSTMTLLTISEMLEAYTKKKAGHALSQSLALNVESVWQVRLGEDDINVPLADIAVGDTIRLRTGGIIPLDGEVLEGTAMINEATMTGEPLAVKRGVGESVFAGTVVEEGSLIIRVRALEEGSRIANIVKMIDSSEALKAGVQGKAEKLADSIVPFSFCLSGITLLFTRNPAKALSVLMVDYSCALKLMTPISVITAMRQAADERILVKGGKFLEAYANADTIVFDKTGTLTEALPKVAKVVPFGGRKREDVLKISACLEEHFPHSVAKAIVHQAETENLKHREKHADVQYRVAHGISSKLEGEQVLIGSGHFIFEDEGTDMNEDESAIIEREANGYSSVFLAIGGKLAGMICVEDPVRADASQALEKLRGLGFERIIMLTGDSRTAADSACKQLGINDFHAGLLPEDKADIIRDLRAQGRVVVMVGDGVNDSPALSCADVSVAMRDGSDIAKEIADITLLGESLGGLATLRRLSNSAFARIDRNYRFILGFNSLLLALGLGGVIKASTSALLHNTSTMTLCALSARQLKSGN